MSWRMVKIGDILQESKEVSFAPNPDKRIRVRLNVQGVEKRPSLKSKGRGTKYYIRKKGQFIYGKQNLFKGAFGIVPDELDGFESSSDIPAFDVDASCLSEWIVLFLRQGNFYKKLEKIATGTGSRRIQPVRLYKVEIPLPSISIQRKVIESCNQKEKTLQKLQSEIKTQKKLLTQLRQAILQEAVQGKLVPQDSKEESASVLLERIKTEKAKLVVAKKIRKPKYLPPIGEEEKPFELPDGWVWCRLGEIVKETPRNGYSIKAVSYETKVKNLTLTAITKGYFQSDKFKYLDIEINEDSYLWLKKGDFLIQRSNSLDYVGTVAIYDGKDKEFIYPDLMMKFQTFSELEKLYIYYSLSAPFARKYFKEKATGTSSNMPKINQNTVRSTLIPLPPLSEQKRIVTKVQQLLGHCAALEAEVLKREKDVGVLVQAVLGEAFNSSSK